VRTRSLHRLVFASIALWALASGARATVLTTSFDFVLGTGQFFNGSGPFAQCETFGTSCTATDTQTVTGSYALFDPLLGALNGISATLTSTFPLGTEILGNRDVGEVSATGSSSYDVGGLFTGSFIAPTSSCISPCNVSGMLAYVLDLTAALSPDDWSSFIGVGTGTMAITQSISVLGSALAPTGMTARARSNQLFTQGWRGTLAISYDYTPTVTTVPEPATLALVTLGLGGVLLRRRRG